MENLSSSESLSAHLKKATVEDIPILLEIERSVSGSKIYSPMLDESEWREELTKGVVYLIEKDSKVVGSLSYEKKGDDHVYISGLVIVPEFQGQGIGREVLTVLLKQFENVKRVDLVTHPDNTVALTLYESLGFVVESRKEDYYGDGEPRLVLVKNN